MAFVLIVEDGTCVAGANSYASVTDGNAYHAGRLYSTAWTGAASDDIRAAALTMATRLIDCECEFLGFRKSATQTLQWPRVQVPDREAPGIYWVPGMVMGLGPAAPVYLSCDSVPQCVIDATCEMARELLIVDRTSAPLGEGLKSSAEAGTTLVFDKTDRRPILTRVVEALLSRVLLGSPGKSAVRLVRS